MSIYYLASAHNPGTFLSTLHISAHSILIEILSGGYFYYSSHLQIRRLRHREVITCKFVDIYVPLFPQKSGAINYATYLIGLLCRLDEIFYIRHLAKGLEHSKCSILKHKVPHYLIGVPIHVLLAVTIKKIASGLRKWPNEYSSACLGWGGVYKNIPNLGIGGQA